MALTPEQQEYYSSLVDNSAAGKAAADFGKEPEVDFESYAKQLGAPVDQIKQEMAKAAPPQEPGLQQNTGDMAASAMVNKGSIKKDLVVGAAQGVADVAQNVMNFGIEIADGLENYAAEFGIGTGELITSADRIDWAAKLGSPEDSLTTRASRQITKYAAPALATMGAGGGVALGLGVDAAANLLTLDPKQERLSSMLRDEVPELKNYPIAYKAIDYLSNKPDETALEGRFKNMIEGLGIAAPLAGVFAGISKAGRAMGLGKKVATAAEAGASADGIVAAAGADSAQAADNVVADAVPKAPAIKPYSQMDSLEISQLTPDQVKQMPEIDQKLYALDKEHIATNEQMMALPENSKERIFFQKKMEQLQDQMREVKFAKEPPLYNYEPVAPTAAGKASVNMNNDDVVAFAAEYSKANPKGTDEVFRGVKPGEELSEEVAAALNDPEQMKAILSWKLGDRPLTDVETKVAQHIMGATYTSVQDAARAVNTLGNDDSLLHLANMVDTFNYVDNARSGAGSEAGRALNAHKLGADLAEMEIGQYNKMLGDKGRQQLVADAIKASGGKENLKEVAKQVQAISEMSDEAVAEALSTAAPASGYTRWSNVLQAVAINGMLSSPKTVAANLISNGVTTTNTMMTNFIAAGVGTIRGTKDAVTIAQSNGYIRGLMGSWFEGMAAAGNALVKGRGGPANVIKGDLLMPTKAISSEALGIPVEKNLAFAMIGKVVDGTGLAVGLPSRINATADAFWGTVMYRGKKYQMAIAAAEQAGLKGDDYAAAVQKNMSRVTVKEHEELQAFAKENTFSKALDPGSFSEKFDSAIEKIPMGRVVFPFFKTTANIINYSIEHSPLTVALGPTRDAIMRGGREGDIAIAKGILGSTMLGAGAYLASEGIITGPDTRNPRMKQALEESGTGWQPDSFKIGDHYVAYNRVDPFNAYMRLGAVLSSLRNYTSEDEYQEAAAMAGVALADFMTPEMMVDGYGKFMDAYSAAVSYKGDKQAANKFFSDQAAKFIPFSALQRDIKSLNDPTKKDTVIATKDAGWLDKFTDRLINRYQAVSPWHNENLPVQRNMFGEPLLVPDGLGPDMISPFATSKAGSTQLVQQLAKLAGFKEQMGPDDPTIMNLPIAMPSRTWTYQGVSIELDPHQYERYVMYSAGLDPATNKPLMDQGLRSTLESVLGGFKEMDTNMSPREYNKIVGRISDVILRYRKIGQAMMLEDQEIMDKWQKSIEASTTPQNIDRFR